MKWVTYLAGLICLLGALNIGFWGCFQFDFIAWFFHSNTAISSRIVYGVVGASALIVINNFKMLKNR